MAAELASRKLLSREENVNGDSALAVSLCHTLNLGHFFVCLFSCNLSCQIIHAIQPKRTLGPLV